ncbi:MAG: AAA family ATPase [Pararhodobacter sp.]
MLRKSIVFTPDFPFLGQPKAAITERWLAHWQRLRALKQVSDSEAAAPAGEDDAGVEAFDDAERRMAEARHRIQWRAERLVKARERAAGIGALKREILDPLREALKQGIALAGPASEHEADELAAALFAELPWMGAAIEPLWRDMRISARQGRGLHFRPILLDGPPGIGKSHLAQRLAALAALPWTSIDLGSTTEGFPIAGAERTWGSAMPGRPVRTILTHRIANPIVFVDELDKAGVAYSSSGASTSAHNALLSLVEPGTAQRWPCPYFGLRFDMRHVNWILAANAIAPLPAPLRSRLRIVSVRGPNRAEMITFAARSLRQRGLPEDALVVLERLILTFPEGDPRLDLRRVLRMIEDIDQRSQDVSFRIGRTQLVNAGVG